VLRGFLTQAGISNDQYVFYDGSGLSRQNLVTPHAHRTAAAVRCHPALGRGVQIDIADFGVWTGRFLIA